MPSLLAGLGVPGESDALALGDHQHAVVLLVDGLGEVPLRRALESGAMAPTLSEALARGRVVSAPFPSTTPVGLASLGTGLDAGCHGIVGASFVLPETGHVLWPLAWRDDPMPLAVQPEPTALERAASAGVRVTSVSPRAFRGSGLTVATLRGGEYRGADSFGERVGGAIHAARGIGPSLTYVYWGDLDKNGHVHGVDSAEWRAELELVDLLVSRLINVLPAGSRLVVTADHGMLDTSDDDRVQLDDHPTLRHGVAHIAGEPRVRHVYARGGAAAEVLDAWTQALAGRAVVMARHDAIADGWFGDVDPELAQRVGDVVAVATGSTVLASELVDSRSSALIGQHGAVTDDELRIPLLAWHV